MAKINYLLRSISNIFTNNYCPYCNNSNNKVIDRKYIFTTLQQCTKCNLYFRHPKDTPIFNKEFYQEKYKQSDGITTDLPNAEELLALVTNNFAVGSKDYSEKINILEKIVNHSPIKIIDFGANWGYTSYQFKKKGWDVQSYEISQPRAAFGKKIDIDIHTSIDKLTGEVDIFFNSHVIEHLADIKEMLMIAQKLLKNDGLFVCYCPNGSDAFKKNDKKAFHKLWGEVHPNYLNDNFFKGIFKDVPYLIGSNNSKISEILNWNGHTQTILNISGYEFFVFAKIANQQL